MMSNKIMSYNKDFFTIEKNKTDYPNSMKSYHYHNNIEVYYLCSGERYYFIKDKTYHIKKGCLVLINEYDIHCTKTSNDSGYERYLLNFSNDFLKDFKNTVNFNLFECFEKNFHIIQLDKNEQYYIESILKNMENEFVSKNKNYIDCIKIGIIQIMLLVNRHIDDTIEKNIEIKTKNKTISQIIGYINNHYYEDISLETISDNFFISPYYFSRTFKKATNYSFIDYLNNVRIKEAQELLKHTEMNITKISEKVGYKSPTHFGRIFKKITGTSPTIYKKTFL